MTRKQTYLKPADYMAQRKYNNIHISSPMYSRETMNYAIIDP